MTGGLLAAIEAREAKVVVMGLGYVGLRVALRASEAGFTVYGFDTDPVRVAQLAAGGTTVADVPVERVAAALESGRFVATGDASVVGDAGVVLICVSTPLSGDLPDLTFVRQAAASIVPGMRPGQLIVLESTTYPGTTENLLREILEGSGLKVGDDFFLGFSPERIDPGNPDFDLENVPKIVGGIDPASTEVMTAFYSTLVETVVPVSSPAAAEMAKLLENTYRHINIAFANEMAMLCHDLGIDVWEVIDAASTKPFGFHPFYPGPGWGGHCIPVDPAYLSWRVRQMGKTARFVELAREFNAEMPVYIVDRITDALAAEGKQPAACSVLVLGVAYKPEVADMRESPALKIIDLLSRTVGEVSFHDPYIPAIRVGEADMSSVQMSEEVLGGADLVLLHTAHRSYDPVWIAAHSRLILDTRNHFKGVRGPIQRL